MHSINTEHILFVSYSSNENNHFLEIRQWDLRNTVQDYKTRQTKFLDSCTPLEFVYACNRHYFI